MKRVRTIEESFESFMGTHISLVVTRPENSVDKKTPISVALTFSPTPGATANLLATVYGVRYKDSEVVTTALFESENNLAKEFATTFCSLLVKKLGLPSYVSVGGTITRQLEYGGQLEVVERCMKQLVL